jgi:S1-C subfamily serine protease
VAEVAPYSAAAAAGMRPGQLIRSINGRAVRTPADAAQALRSLRPGAAVSVRVLDPELGETVVNYRARS